MMAFRFIFILNICFSAFSAASQTEYLPFKHLGTDEGLSQNTVTNTVKDKDGFLWFGTQQGLNRYDGYRFYVYKNKPGDYGSLPTNGINCLYIDSKGRMWVGTNGGGLSLYVPETETFLSFQEEASPHSISNNGVTSIDEDSNGNLWIGTYWGLNVLNPETFVFQRFYNSPDDSLSLSNNGISSVAVDQQDNVWVGTLAAGLNRFNTKTFQSTRFTYDANAPSGISSNNILHLLVDDENSVWIGTEGSGLDIYHEGKFTHYGHDPKGLEGLTSNAITALAHNRDGRIWVGTENGLNLVDIKKQEFLDFWSNPDDNASLTTNSIQSIYKDDKDILWVGTFSGGINFYDPNLAVFERYQTPVKTVNAFVQDPAGLVWVGTDGGGLSLFNPIDRSLTSFKGSANQLSSPGIVSLLCDRAGNIWVGTYGGGLNFYNRETNVFTYYEQGDDPTQLSNSKIYALLEDKRDRIWIGTLGGGLNVLDRSTKNITKYVANVEVPGALSNNTVSSLAQDKDGHIWVGTYGDGVNLYNETEDNFTVFLSANSGLSNNSISSLFFDSHDNLWVGTLGGGINRFNKATKKFTSYTEADGLCNDIVSSIEEDGQGILWISTARGLSRFDPQTGVFTNYDGRDGLQSSEFKKGSSLKIASGEILLGGVNGFNIFNPAGLKTNPHVPRVVITNFQVFNKPVEMLRQRSILYLKEIELTHEQTFFTIEFAALNYTLPSKNRYAYRLTGFDKDWIYTGSEQKASYTNVNPGNYIFEVKAANNDGVWNEASKSLAIIIAPPYWHTWWFRVLGGILGVTLVLLIYKRRIATIEIQKQELERLVKSRTVDLAERNRDLEQFTYIVSHNLRGPVSNLIGLSTILSEVKLKEEEYRESLKGLTTSVKLLDDVITDLNQILQVRQVEAEKKEKVRFSALVNSIKTSISHIIEKEKVEIICDFFESDEIVTVKSYLNSIFHNLISNSIKYCRADANPVIEIRSQIRGNQVDLIFKDNGMGIDLQKKGDKVFGLYNRFHHGYAEGKGMGLYMVKTQVESLGGKIFVDSEVGKGTTFTIRFFD